MYRFTKYSVIVAVMALISSPAFAQSNRFSAVNCSPQPKLDPIYPVAAAYPYPAVSGTIDFHGSFNGGKRPTSLYLMAAPAISVLPGGSATVEQVWPIPTAGTEYDLKIDTRLWPNGQMIRLIMVLYFNNSYCYVENYDSEVVYFVNN